MTFTIAKATPTVSVTDAGGTYNGSPFPATVTVKGVSGSVTASLEGVTPTVTYCQGSSCSSTPPTQAGTYTATADFPGSADYAAVTSTPVTFTIAKATPTVSVTDAGGTYNGSPFPATVTVKGVSGSAAANLEGVTPTVTYCQGSSCSSTPPTQAGTYTVTADFPGSTDYAAVTSTPVTFTIAPGAATVTIIDNSQPVDATGQGFSQSGSWTAASTGLDGGSLISSSPVGSGQSQAKWSFTQLQPGTYDVAVTWVPESNLSATVNYNVCDGSKTCQTVSVNQQYSPDDYTDQGVTWRRLGTFTITGTSLVVSAANSGSDGQICADAVRVSPVSSPVLPGIVHVTSANFQQQVMQSQVPVLVDFYADWCEWCQKQDPALEDIADNYSNVKIAKINIDESPALAQQYNIDAIPHLFVFRNGQEVTDALGLQTERNCWRCWESRPRPRQRRRSLRSTAPSPLWRRPRRRQPPRRPRRWSPTLPRQSPPHPPRLQRPARRLSLRTDTADCRTMDAATRCFAP